MSVGTIIGNVANIVAKTAGREVIVEPISLLSLMNLCLLWFAKGESSYPIF